MPDAKKCMGRTYGGAVLLGEPRTETLVVAEAQTLGARIDAALSLVPGAAPCPPAPGGGARLAPEPTHRQRGSEEKAPRIPGAACPHRRTTTPPPGSDTMTDRHHDDTRLVLVRTGASRTQMQLASAAIARAPAIPLLEAIVLPDRECGR